MKVLCMLRSKKKGETRKNVVFVCINFVVYSNTFILVDVSKKRNSLAFWLKMRWNIVSYITSSQPPTKKEHKDKKNVQ